VAEPSELAQGLGKVLTNLLSLEVCLRLFLYDLQGLKRPTGGSTPPQHDFTNPTLGAWVPLTPLTSYGPSVSITRSPGGTAIPGHPRL
jgi:hypothetical protein